MTCDCIERINAQLDEEPRAKGRLLLATSMNARTGECRSVLPIYATDYTKGGTPKNGSPIYASFCPFCGKPTEEPAPVPAAS